MNILFIIPSLSGGGAERVTVTLASLLSAKYNVWIATYFETEHNYNLSDSVKVICLNVSDGKNTFKKYANSFIRIRKLHSLKKELKIDIAISMLFSPNFENVMSRGAEKIIVSIRNKCSEQLKGFSARINSFTCRKADKVVALSKNVMCDQIKCFSTPPQNIVTIYNPCDIRSIHNRINDGVTEEFKKIRQKSDFMLITAGRMTRQKGQWHMIRAFSKVVECNLRATLVILGKGELNAYLADLINNMNLQDNVFLLGFHKNPYPYLAQADVFAFTSLFEGFGNILLEAMACNLPIISCDCDAGPRELLDPSTDRQKFAKNIEKAEFGILTPVMDGTQYTCYDKLSNEELEFADAVKMIMKDEELREHYKEMSRIRIKDFSIDVILQEWIDIL